MGDEHGSERRSATGASGEVRRRQLATLLEHSPDATVIVDAEGLICEWNPAAETLLGRSRHEVIDVPARRLVRRTERVQFDAVWAQLVAGRAGPPSQTFQARRAGAWASVSAHIAPITAGGRFAGVVAILRGDPVPPEQGQVGSQGATGTAVPIGADGRPGSAGAEPGNGAGELDALTGLAGRRRLQRRLAEPIPAGLARGVAVLDVDAFALINEAYGPDAGDAIVVEVAGRLAAVAGTADLGRWQADLFVLVVDTPEPARALAALNAAVAATFDEPFRAGTDSLRLTMSMGLVTSGLAPAADLLATARDALHAAEQAGGDQTVWYSEALHRSPAGAFRLANDLHRGIQDGDLRLHFQPIIQLATDDVAGVEALVRWQRLGAGLLAPASFLEVAERTGQIVLLGAWVARNACLAAADLVRLADRPHSVSINVSGRQLTEPGLVDMLRGAIQDSGCEPSAIIIEVTETALMYDMEAATATLEAVKALGVGLDLDDFGTGYSSLLYLKHFPVDRIKIDQSFVAGLGSNYADAAIVASTIALAHSIGIRAVAEGVETAEQLAILRQMGCDFAQGFHFSRPLGFDSLTAWLAQHGPGHDLLASDADVAAKDAAARGRDRVGAERERLADERDRLADERERLADVREGLADARDEVADVRDAEGAERSAFAQWDAELDPSRASGDRAGAEPDQDAADVARDAPVRDEE